MAVTTESRTSPRTEPRVEKGVSLARGPALILGTILLAAGLYMLYKQHFFPKFSNFPDGTATVKSKVLFGLFGANGWTGMLTAICGGLLLFGAAQHLLAKTMSLIVGVVLAAAAIIGLVNHGNVFGLVATNHLTELAWGIAAVILLFNTLIPRRTRTIEPAYDDRAAGRRGGGKGRVAAGAAAGAGAGAVAEHEHDRHRERRAEERAAEDGNGDQAGAAAPVGDRGAGAGAPVGDRGAGAAAPASDRGAGSSEPVGDRGPGGQTAGGPAATNRADDATNVQQRGTAGAQQGGTAGAQQGGQGGGQVGLAERARRWLRPGSEN
jgi:hypothetical protein